MRASPQQPPVSFLLVRNFIMWFYYIMKSIIKVKGKLYPTKVSLPITSNWVSVDDYTGVKVDYQVKQGDGLIAIEGGNTDDVNSSGFVEFYKVQPNQFVNSIEINTKFDFYRINVYSLDADFCEIDLTSKLYNKVGKIIKCINFWEDNTYTHYNVEEFDTLDFKIRNDGGVNVDFEVRISYLTHVGTAFKEDDVIFLKSDTDTAGKVIDIKGISRIKVFGKTNTQVYQPVKIEGLLY